MLHESQSFLIGKIWRPLAGIRVEVHAVNDAGSVVAAWGVYVQEELTVDPLALRRDLNQLAQIDGAVVRNIEERVAFSVQEVAHFIIETTPGALYGAALAEGLHAIIQRLKKSADSADRKGLPGGPIDREALLANSIRQAEYLAKETYRIHFQTLTVNSHSLSETAKPEDATANIVFTAQDGSVISVHLWVADGETLSRPGKSGD